MGRFDSLLNEVGALWLDRIAKKIDRLMDDTNRSELTPDEHLEFQMLYQIGKDLKDASQKIKYLEREIEAEGILYKNDAGRYEIDESNYFTSGESIEVLVYDEDYGNRWVATRVEHKDGDYYAVGVTEKLGGLRARVRRRSYFD